MGLIPIARLRNTGPSCGVGPYWYGINSPRLQIFFILGSKLISIILLHHYLYQLTKKATENK